MAQPITTGINSPGSHRLIILGRKPTHDDQTPSYVMFRRGLAAGSHRRRRICSLSTFAPSHTTTCRPTSQPNRPPGLLGLGMRSRISLDGPLRQHTCICPNFVLVRPYDPSIASHRSGRLRWLHMLQNVCGCMHMCGQANFLVLDLPQTPLICR